MAEVNEKFIFIFCIEIFQHLHLVCSECDHLNNIPNKKKKIILTVASKHFGHVRRFMQQT